MLNRGSNSSILRYQQQQQGSAGVQLMQIAPAIAADQASMDRPQQQQQQQVTSLAYLLAEGYHALACDSARSEFSGKR